MILPFLLDVVLGFVFLMLTLGARYSGDCLIVRSETPYDAEGVTSVDYEAEEGSLVHRGTNICNV